MLETWDGRSMNPAVALLLHERRQLSLGEPWAIAQLSLSDDDSDKLLAWAREITGARLAALIARTDRIRLPPPAADLFPSLDSAVGLLLLAICSDAVRRHGSTYAVWPAIAQRLASVPDVDALVSPTAGATAALKSALYCAAHQFGMLGGDFSQQRTNRWYRLLLLQAGIPDGEVPR